MTSRHVRITLACSALALVGLVAACSGSSNDSGSSASDVSLAPKGAVTAAAPSLDDGIAQDSAANFSVSGSAVGALASRTSYKSTNTPADAQQPAIISTGAISLRADDVAAARFHAGEIVDGVSGSVDSEKAEADAKGHVLRTRVVLRVPSTAFDATMDKLAAVGHLVSKDSTSEDVTTDVIDTDVKVRTERASIDRIQVLLARAKNIRDVVSIERELSQRQSSLNSLEQRQAYLADQTSMATITLSIERTPKKPEVAPVVPPAEHHRGFLAGLKSGWHGLSHATVAVLTAGGALLPFALVVLVLGVPAWLVVRRRRRSGVPATTPAAAS